MTPRDESAHLDRVLEGRALPESEIERLAIRMVSSPPRAAMPAHVRAGSWERVLDEVPPRRPSGISQRPAAHRHIDNRRHGIFPTSFPAPGVVLFGLMLSLVVAFGGRIDDPGRTMPAAASTTASPASWAPVATPVPTPAPLEDAIDV